MHMHSILSPEEHGFRKYHSCKSQLVTTINDFAIHVDLGVQIDTILLDFSKSFDKILQQCLVVNLTYCGIQRIATTRLAMG